MDTGTSPLLVNLIKLLCESEVLAPQVFDNNQEINCFDNAWPTKKKAINSILDDDDGAKSSRATNPSRTFTNVQRFRNVLNSIS
jgi:hypothetical protein